MPAQTQLVKVDETTCDREPIHILGHIQPRGFFIAADRSFHIVQVSENLATYLGLKAADLPGKKLTGLGFIGMEDKVSMLRLKSPKQIDLFEIAYSKNNATDYFDAIAHFSGDKLIIELEPCVAEFAEGTYQELLNRLTYLTTRSESGAHVLNQAVTIIKKYAGYDRVMIYQFMKDGHGQVVAEERETYLEPFLGMYYPASDIPKQARELFIKNVVRIIADVDATDVPLLPYLVNGQPTDLSLSNLRSVSPMHVQYLKNMGVKASFSISIIIDGALWGLISCHHYKEAKFLPYTIRQNCVLVSRLLSATVQSWIHKEEEELRKKTTAVVNTLVAQIKQNWNVPFGLTNYHTTVADIFEEGGAAVILNDKLHLLGKTPSEKEVRELIQWLNDTSEKYFETNRLPLLFTPAKAYRKTASGILAITLSKELKEYIIWFKPELMEEVSWGGNPEKAMQVNNESGEVTLTPRKSFAKWTEELEFHARPWKEAQIAGVLKLREDLLQIINFKANELRQFNEKLRIANQELDAFSYTISHDLRTPLTSIYSYSELLLEIAEKNKDKESKELLNMVLRNAKRMNDMIKAILQYARINSTPIKKTAVNMQPVLKDVAATVTSSYKNKVTISIGHTPELFAEPVMLTQVFQNLIDNAVKYSSIKETAIIAVSGTETADEVVYSVEDNGIGIDMKYADKIFEIFSRLHNNSDYSGYGVGLSIVKRIMERFYGKVWFESKLNEGTTFYVAFPKH
jgi:two-component system, chemotaxis family, sensor kinase Cph1